MATLALNALVIAWVSLLLFAPGLAWGVSRGLSAALLAGSSALTLTAISLVTFVTAQRGYGTIGPLRVCAAVLTLLLLWAAVRFCVAIRSRSHDAHRTGEWLALPVGLIIGIWALTPALLKLGRAGVTFGLATLGNADLANYVLAAENVAQTGFSESHHVANSALGAFSQHYSYTGATALINFATAATGLPAWKVTLCTIGIAITLLAVSLWAVAAAVWPSARYSIPAAVCVGCLAAISTYTDGEFFLASVLGLASVSTALAGATLTGRGVVRPGLLMVASGGALGVFSYAHLGLPALLGLPAWAFLTAVLVGRREPSVLVRTTVQATGAAAAGIILSFVALDTALNLVKSQSQALAGWKIPPLSATSAFLWPMGIGHRDSVAVVVGSWLAVGAIGAAGFVAAWRRGFRSSVLVGALLTAASVAVVLGAVVIYGPERYQTWKMEAFLLPIVAAIFLPAVSTIRARDVRIGPAFLAAVTGIVSLGPALVWQSTVSRPAAAVVTSRSLAALANDPRLSRLSSVNVRLAPFFETMSAGGIIPTQSVVLSSRTYYAAKASLATCTLTRRDMLAPGETNFTDLGGGYVLLQRPSKCAEKP